MNFPSLLGLFGFFALGLSGATLLLAAPTTQGVRETNVAPQVKLGTKQQPKSSTREPRKRASANKEPAQKVEVREIDDAALRKLLQVDAAGSAGPLLVNFWATWCEPCRDEFPDLNKLDAKYRPRGLRFITVSLDDPAELKTSVPQFLREMNSQAPAYLLNTPDPAVSISAVDPQWTGAVGLPVTFLFDKRGQIVFKHMSRIKPAELQTAIEKVMSNE